ncbi:MAG: hypothetical protein CSA79_03790 [Thiothrix nivea]|nr:MAG: hypothetical protein CSA79_03790 [Thiothrix nivea]
MISKMKIIFGIVFIVSSFSGSIAIAESKPAASWFIVPQNKHATEVRKTKKLQKKEARKWIAGGLLITKKDTKAKSNKD